MPDSGAVYQPTTVGYTYDSGGDGTGGGGGGTAGIRNGFLRVMSRHKISSRRWAGWVLFSVALCFFVAGLTTMLISLVSGDTSTQTDISKTKSDEELTTVATKIEDHVDEEPRGSIALGAGMMLVGLLVGFVWVWLHFFRRSKSSRNGVTGSSGQMLGGLNPSTDLLVGSTSQYGPVLTELPSQLKMKSANEAQTVPLSDQEEETRTLMQDSTTPTNASIGGPNAITTQIPG